MFVKSEGSGIGFKEEDAPNFTGSFYSKTKAMMINIPNSMTILDELLLPISIEMRKCNLVRIWNFTNLGVVRHNEILEMYKKYINPEFIWANFTLEEQAKGLIHNIETDRVHT
ncbi:hypothetical protein RND71_025007 [Anisodus tanguticus]|uniref:Uncharacterized protein n=1 Tax=Anisodus tanguticus TaxID=243964 RepID=A0AAE1VA03_9SOLA|nr:hypothetical protein RND71_025007 [Anisodus tanguticus]